MFVNIGGDFTVKIGHLTRMGSLNDVLAIGNSYRIKNDLRPIELHEWLQRRDTWEFINEVEQRLDNIKDGVIKEIPSLPFDDKGRVIYSKLIKQFTVIKSQRGGKVDNRGVWANLYIMLDLAIYMSPKLKFEMIEIFINNKLLEWRDISGDEFKSLNKTIDSNLPGREDKTSNTGIYINIAKTLNLRILGEKGTWNDASSEQLNLRANLEGKLINVLELGLVKDWEHMKEIIGKL